MDPRERIVVRIPLIEIWDSTGTLPANRGKQLGVKDIRELLRLGPVRFVIADCGDLPNWIPLAECFNIWKQEIQPHLAEPAPAEARSALDDFPGGYYYVATEWTGVDGPPIVVLEMHH